MDSNAFRQMQRTRNVERLMEIASRGLVIVFGSSFKQNLERLDEVFSRLVDTGLKLKKLVSYLGVS